MRVLLADLGPEIKDQIEVGLEAFEGMQVTAAQGFVALDHVRSSNWSVVLVGIQGKAEDPGQELLDWARQERADLPVIVVAPDLVIQRFRADKARNRVFGFLRTPLDPVELFRTVRRIVQRSEAPALR